MATARGGAAWLCGASWEGSSAGSAGLCSVGKAARGQRVRKSGLACNAWWHRGYLRGAGITRGWVGSPVSGQDVEADWLVGAPPGGRRRWGGAARRVVVEPETQVEGVVVGGVVKVVEHGVPPKVVGVLGVWTSGGGR